MASTDKSAVGEIAVPVTYRQPAIYERWARGLFKFARRKPLGAFGGLIIIILILTGLFGGMVAPYAYDDIDIYNRLQTPSLTSGHLMGTDDQGRDVFSRILFGARTSIFIGFGAVTLSIVLATAVGITSAYWGGLYDLLFQRLIDVKLAFPGMIFLLFFASIFGSAAPTLVLALGILFFGGSSRLIRGAALSIKQELYVEAARGLGAGTSRIMLQYILPNVFAIVLISASLQIGSVILVEASLSFLGYGVPPPFPSWGRMLQDAQLTMYHAPYLAIFPGLAIAVVVYSFNMFGDAVRDIMDPRLRGGGR